MNKTWINVTGTAVTGWAEGPAAPAEDWFEWVWVPEKSLAAYEYVDHTWTVTGPDPAEDAAEDATIETKFTNGKIIQQRADWKDPE